MRKICIYFNLLCFSVWQWQVTGWAKWFKDLKTLIQLVTPSITSLSLELFIPLTLTQLIALFGVAWAVRRYKHGRRRWRARKPPWSWQPTHDHREKCSLSCDWSVSGDPGPWLVRWDLRLSPSVRRTPVSGAWAPARDTRQRSWGRPLIGQCQPRLTSDWLRAMTRDPLGSK